jgi:hypothetical protein
MGDVNNAMHFYRPSPAAGIIWRYNFNPRNSIRFGGMYAGIKGEPVNQPWENYTGTSFSSGVIDVSLTTEFNFIPYESTKTRSNRYSPYICGGFGYSVFLDKGSAPHLSFGGGIKYNFTTRLSAGAECSFRKTFSDEVDGVQNIGSEIITSFFHNKDWYSIVGVFVTYKIFDWGLDCAAYE